MDNIIITTAQRVARLAPPKVIRLSKPDTDHTDAMLWISYDMMIETKPNGLVMTETTIHSRPADTYHLIEAYHTEREWHDLMSEAGWYFGAGYLVRWRHAPRGMPHLFGMERYDLGEGDVSATGDTDDVLDELAKQFGVWQWEINSAWRREDRLIKWRKEDNCRNESGLRTSQFPGWDGEHAILRNNKTDYESHYYYIKPPKYNRYTDVLVKDQDND